MSSNAKRLRQIVVDDRNYEMLRALGHVTDSFNDVITKILEQNQKVKEMKLNCT
jgi:predicted CopG family antitoxin